ncbi:hypothetical protein [Blastococcus deserti]|uniref:Uncharacterized protein n=1 Tax=Blastococcus deserti TaxID=2259033 RepID=A0ABW4X9R0_9ACTN
MSYLGWPRFHFAGTFVADPSTVNNDPVHYDNDSFDRAKSWVQGGDGWWNPDGRHSFRFENVTVRSAIGEDGQAVDGDPVVGLRFVTRGITPAKLVDLDPDQQLVSQIFGMQVALSDGAGNLLVQGAMRPVAFTDIWRRGVTGSGDEAACAAYQSTLETTEWADQQTSQFLGRLRDAAGGRPLAIKFNVDGYSMSATRPDGTPNPRFTRGRVVGTVGIAGDGEPRHTVVGRQFGSVGPPPGDNSPGFRPPGGVNYFPGVVDTGARKVRLDLGNALPAATAGGPPQDIGELVLGCHAGDGTVTEVAPIDYRAAGWYETTAGIVDLPAGRTLRDDEVARLEAGRLLLVARRDGQQRTVIEEAPVHVRADEFVARLDPGEEWVVRLHVSERGRPLPGARVSLFHLRTRDPEASAQFPTQGLTFPESVTSDAHGIAQVTLRAGDPGNLRFFYFGDRRQHVDGQVYRVGYRIEGGTQPNPSNVLSVLVWNRFVPDEPPTWFGSMRDVFVQYGNLYPWMTKFGPQLDLALYEAIAAQRESVIEVLNRPVADSRYMPVSRDLSGSRRTAMLTWLTSPGPDGKPLLGEQRESDALEVAPAPPPETIRRGGPDPALGGKTAAAQRLGLDLP